MPKTRGHSFVLSTADALTYSCNHLETKHIYFVEKVRFDPQKALTKKGLRSIVKKVPRGLRNSKPPET
jgi:predicted carbohydrate-binding protein with CBM5 and CBM33 domain